MKVNLTTSEVLALRLSIRSRLADLRAILRQGNVDVEHDGVIIANITELRHLLNKVKYS